MEYCLTSTNDKPILVDDGTLDYVVQLPSGRIERFNREYVLDTYGDCAAGSLAQLLAEEIEWSDMASLAYLLVAMYSA